MSGFSSRRPRRALTLIETLSPLLLWGVIVVGAVQADGPRTEPSATAAQKPPRVASGDDASVQVRLGLWCEAHGMAAERLEHLSRAILDQPSNVLARALLGFVRYQGKWLRLEAVGQKLSGDSARAPVIREYLERRAATPDTPEAQMKLADWCAANRLKEEALAHYQAVIRLDPSRDAAWRSLGYKKQGHRWVRPEQLAAGKQEAIRQKQADKQWRTKLAKLRDDLQSKDAAKRSRAEQALGAVTDPRAVPSIWAVFVTGGDHLQMAAIGMFGQIDGPSASSALAALAILSPSPDVRAQALQTLLRRDPRDVVGRLIGLLHKPYKYDVRRSGGAGSPDVLFIEGERFSIQRLYENQSPDVALQAAGGRIYSPDVPFDPFSIQNGIMASGAWAASLLTLTPHGLQPSSSAPIDPTAIGQAMKAMAANPKNAQAIFSQLASDPNNRIIPPGYTFTLTDPSYSIAGPGQRLPSSAVPPFSMPPPTPAQMRDLQAFAAQLRAQQNNPLSPMGMAMELQKLENNPAHQQSGAQLGYIMQAQQMAAQRDLQIGLDLMAVQQANLDSQQRLTAELQFIERTNEGIRQTNARVLPVLKAITGLDLGIDREKWKRWWMGELNDSPGSGQRRESLGNRESGTGSTAVSIPAAGGTVPERGPADNDAANGPRPAFSVRASFAVGTPVRTIGGLRPVEALQVGDRVLCQNFTTGELEYQPVLAVHRNRPAPTVRISAGGESIVATDLERFWKPGRGWTMARDLDVGDRLRIVGGVIEVASIAHVPSQSVYNVEVAEHGDLFVGAKGILAHDFGFVPAVPEPFDRCSEVTEAETPAESGRTYATGRVGPENGKGRP
jgi:hypothetical protein